MVAAHIDAAKLDRLLRSAKSQIHRRELAAQDGGAVGLRPQAHGDGLAACQVQAALDTGLRDHFPQLSFKPVTRLNTGLAPAT